MEHELHLRLSLQMDKEYKTSKNQSQNIKKGTLTDSKPISESDEKCKKSPNVARNFQCEEVGEKKSLVIVRNIGSEEQCNKSPVIARNMETEGQCERTPNNAKNIENDENCEKSPKAPIKINENNIKISNSSLIDNNVILETENIKSNRIRVINKSASASTIGSYINSVIANRSTEKSYYVDENIYNTTPVSESHRYGLLSRALSESKTDIYLNKGTDICENNNYKVVLNKLSIFTPNNKTSRSSIENINKVDDNEGKGNTKSTDSVYIDNAVNRINNNECKSENTKSKSEKLHFSIFSRSHSDKKNDYNCLGDNKINNIDNSECKDTKPKTEKRRSSIFSRNNSDNKKSDNASFDIENNESKDISKFKPEKRRSSLFSRSSDKKIDTSGSRIDNADNKYENNGRRRSSIFSLLKRQKKVSKKDSDSLDSSSRKYSVDSDNLSDCHLNDALTGLDGVEIEGIALELAGAASDTDSTPEGDAMAGARSDEARMREAAARVDSVYVEDPDTDVGQAGELVEEVAEENRSLLWFLLKQVRPGMDLSKVVLPTFILEPRSFLDKLADTYYHADLLSIAQTYEDPYARFKGVLKWYLSGLYKKPKGLKKPYNPVLGEAFRCCWKHPDTQTYTFYVAEQVSHHPPISAFYISNRKEGYVIEGSLLAKSKFYGNSTSALLEGCARIYLLNWNETYITTAPYAHCKGIIMGQLSMELGGKVNIKCLQSGYNAEIEFKLRSFLGGSDMTNSISGKIRRDNQTVATLEGYWDGRIEIKDKKSGQDDILVDVNQLKEQRLTRYLVGIDNQQEFESQKLWIKVSEAIALEDQVAATREKTIIEEAQRARAKNATTPWVPRYFHRDAEPKPNDGLPDQGYSYNFSNPTPWGRNEVFEYEEDFKIQSIISSTTTLHRASGTTVQQLARASASTVRTSGTAIQDHSDSDSQLDVGKRTKAKSIKQSLNQIDSAIRAQTAVLEQLQRQVQALNENRSSRGMDRYNDINKIDTTIHAQTDALEHLRSQVRNMSQDQNEYSQPARYTARASISDSFMSPTAHLIAGFILALFVQAFLVRLFY